MHTHTVYALTLQISTYLAACAVKFRVRISIIVWLRIQDFDLASMANRAGTKNSKKRLSQLGYLLGDNVRRPGAKGRGSAIDGEGYSRYPVFFKKFIGGVTSLEL